MEISDLESLFKNARVSNNDQPSGKMDEHVVDYGEKHGLNH
jgi:hypothetical protein